jgi:hypothetical protein
MSFKGFPPPPHGQRKTHNDRKGHLPRAINAA